MCTFNEVAKASHMGFQKAFHVLAKHQKDLEKLLVNFKGIFCRVVFKNLVEFRILGFEFLTRLGVVLHIIDMHQAK